MPTHDKGYNRTRSISLSIELDSEMLRRMAELGIESVSEYAQRLIRNDIVSRGDLLIRSARDHPSPEASAMAKGTLGKLKRPRAPARGSA